jgi:hypothetical protein
MSNALKVKKDHQHALDVQHDLPRFLWARRGWACPLTEHLSFFWVETVNPGSVCYDPREEVSVISDFIQQFLDNKHMLLLLLFGEQPRNKLCADLLHVQVLC